jgi:phosphate uptake regulator/aminoglycoside phosphotransferase (APT) family kinase protein
VNSLLLEDLGQDLAMMARLVQSQLVTAMTAFFQRDPGLSQKVTDRDDQVDNLLGLIEEKCFERIATEPAESARSRRLRGVFRVALNLEKLGDYAVNIAEQAVHAARLPDRAAPFDLAGPARVALAALDEVITAFTHASAEQAKDACRCEIELDRQYRAALDRAFERLGMPGQDPAFIMTHLFVSKFLERVGDSILNIGETTLFILTGERLKLHQYLHLEQMVGPVAGAGGGTVDIRQIWGGISGARVGRVAVGGEPLIWKEGAERKIQEELREMAEWNRVIPGLVPDVKARAHDDQGRVSFLGRFLEGTLVRDVYLTRTWEEKVRATRRLCETLRDVWLATSVPEPPRVDYARQIRERLPDLYAIHPELEGLRRRETRVFGIAHRSLDDLLGGAERVESALAPPVRVRIHGDFNTNNIVYDAGHDRVHYIDVHRSGPGDYLQDIGVLLVSNVRNPIGDERLGAELVRLNRMIHDFAEGFARLIGDRHFETRLALSQARSFITSGRLISDPEFAREIYLQGVRLLEQAAPVAA